MNTPSSDTAASQGMISHQASCRPVVIVRAGSADTSPALDM